MYGSGAARRLSDRRHVGPKTMPCSGWHAVPRLQPRHWSDHRAGPAWALLPSCRAVLGLGFSELGLRPLSSPSDHLYCRVWLIVVIVVVPKQKREPYLKNKAACACISTHVTGDRSSATANGGGHARRWCEVSATLPSFLHRMRRS